MHSKSFCVWKIILIFTLLFFLPSFTFADIYKWDDITKPFIQKIKIKSYDPNIVEVFIPESMLKKSDLIPIYIEHDLLNSKFLNPYVQVNDSKRSIYYIKTSKVTHIKTKDLKPGLNKFKFAIQKSTSSKPYIYKISFTKEVVRNSENQYKFSDVYKWEDYTKPFRKNFKINNYKIGIVAVDLPGFFIHNYNEIPLFIDHDINAINIVRPFIKINNSNKAIYYITNQKVTKIKVKDINAGINTLAFGFRISSTINGSINEIRFDLKNLKELSMTDSKSTQQKNEGHSQKVVTLNDSKAHDTSLPEITDFQIKGIDDGIKSSQQQDYREAVLFAKREAIERAGVSVKAMTTVKDMVVESDYISTQSEAILMPGYKIIDMGYSESGIYQIVLIGSIRTK